MAQSPQIDVPMLLAQLEEAESTIKGLRARAAALIRDRNERDQVIAQLAANQAAPASGGGTTPGGDPQACP